MAKKGKISILEKAIRIGEDWDSFLNEHPEIDVIASDGIITDIKLPQKATHITLLLWNAEVLFLEYYFNHSFISFSSPL